MEKNKEETEAPPVENVTKILRGISAIFEGLRMVLDGIAGELELVSQEKVSLTEEASHTDQTSKPKRETDGSAQANNIQETDDGQGDEITDEDADIKVDTGISAAEGTSVSEGSRTEGTASYEETVEDPEDEVLPFEGGSAQESEPTHETELAQGTEPKQCEVTSPATEAEKDKRSDAVLPKDGEAVKPTVTKDMLTKVVVAKIKQNRANSERISQLVKAYGVSQLSDLPESKYESFMSDLSEL